MTPYRFRKLLILFLLFSSNLSACSASENLLKTPTIIVTPEVTLVPVEPSITTSLIVPTESITVTPEPIVSEIPVMPTETVPITATVTTEASELAVPTLDIQSLGLLVFDQERDSIGRMSFDGEQFYPLKQVPKLDAASLEYGLLSENTGFFVSPDGSWLGKIIGYDQLSLIDLENDQRRNIARIGEGAWLGWTPDSQSFAYREGESRVCIYQVPAQKTDCFTEFEGKIAAAAWSPDGSKLALSIAGEVQDDALGLVNGDVWIIDLKSQNVQFIAKQPLPLGGVSSNDLLVWTNQGLIVNQLADDVSATLFNEDNEILLASNAASASPTGQYVIYENGRFEKVSDGNLLTQLPVCDERQGQTTKVIWKHDKVGFAYTVYCAADDSTQLGVVLADNPDSTWNSTIPNNMRLMGWSHDGDYLLFRHEPNEQQQEYKIERLGADPNSTFETLANATFLIDVLGSGVEAEPTAAPNVAATADGWFIYDSAYYSYTLAYPPEATLQTEGVSGFPADEQPADLTFEEYMEQLEETYPEDICLLITYEAGFVSVLAPFENGGKYADVCPGMGIGYDMVPISKTVMVNDMPYLAEGFSTLETDDGVWHGEFLNLRLEDGTRLALGGGFDGQTTREDYAALEQTLLRIVNSLVR